MPLNDNSQAYLDAEWLTLLEMEDRECMRVHTDQICLSYPNFNPTVASSSPADAPPH